MATFHRRTRIAPPTVPTGRLAVQAPPELTPSDGISGLLSSMVPMLGSVGSIVFVAISSPNARGMISAGMFMLASVGFVVVNGWRQRSQHQAGILAARREYLAYLAELRSGVRRAAADQRAAAEWIHPRPQALTALAEEATRVWERAPEDPDFLLVRVGTASQPLCLALDPPDTPPLAQLDPVAASAAHRFIATHSQQAALPLAVDLQAHARIEITGAEDPARALARSMIASLATFHAPDHLLIAVVASPAALPAWEWVKWLPHAHSTRSADAVGPARMIASDLEELRELLPADLTDRPRFTLPGVLGAAPTPPTPHVLLVVDGGQVPPGDPIVPDDGVQGITVLELPEQWDELTDASRIRLDLVEAPGPGAGGSPSVPGPGGSPSAGGPDGSSIGGPGGSFAVGGRPGGRRPVGRPAAELTIVSPVLAPRTGRADALSVVGAEATARRLAPLAVGGAETTSDAQESSELVDLLGVGDVRDIDFDVAWRPRPQRDRLRVPIGLTSEGRPLALDVKESAQGGMGPHGLIIGATGSGKSEVLRTLVLALALTHSPEALNFVLVDFKGGATFAGMAGMPHVSAIITNLGEELSLVDRMQDALHGEMVRRQELLRSAGNFANVSEYEKARLGGREDLDPLPALLIVADEFSELLSAKPEFVDSFVAIGRLGRSLQVHLLLSSQRLEEGRLRGLDSHLSYRIGLRTFSAAESRSVLGVPDAYQLPPVPGMGYLKPDTTTLIQFRAAYVSGPPKARRAATGGPAGPSAAVLEPFTAAPVAAAPVTEVVEQAPIAADEGETRSTFDIAVRRMAGRGPAAHQVWLPPLITPASLDQLMPDLAPDPVLGLVSAGWRRTGELTVPLGIVDRPLEQRRDNLSLSLAGAAGHLAIVGAPRTGKSTLARTLVASFALTHTPAEVQFYVLDFGGGTFTPMAQLAHVAGVAGRSEPDVVRRVVAEVAGILDAREIYFRAHAIDSIETYRTRRAAGLVDDGYGDVFLLVDGWATLRAEFEELEGAIAALAGQGLTYGVHIVATAGRWMDFRTQIKDVFGSRLELRLGDASDSEFDRKQAANVPLNRPGRGLIASKHHMLAALPRIDGSGDAGSLADGVEHLIRAVDEAWHGPAGPKLRLLPDRIDLDQVRAMADEATASKLLLGIDEARLAPVGIDLSAESHLYLFGEADSGKSGMLRAFAAEVTRLYTPQQAKIFMVDYRRSALAEISEDYLAGYLTTDEQAGEQLDALAQYLRSRLPGPDVTPDQLRTRSWWTGAEAFVLVDDYDLVATSAGNPVQALVPLLAQASDVGLHLVITRRTGGASRAAYEPVLQSLRDLGTSGILLSGSPDEGPLIGNVRARASVPGRAQFVSRDAGRQVLQLAWSPPLH